MNEISISNVQEVIVDVDYFRVGQGPAGEFSAPAEIDGEAAVFSSDELVASVEALAIDPEKPNRRSFRIRSVGPAGIVDVTQTVDTDLGAGRSDFTDHFSVEVTDAGVIRSVVNVRPATTRTR